MSNKFMWEIGDIEVLESPMQKNYDEIASDKRRAVKLLKSVEKPKMLKPEELTTVLPKWLSKLTCECGQLIFHAFAGYYNPQTEKKVENCPNCKRALCLLTTRVVKE